MRRNVFLWTGSVMLLFLIIMMVIGPYLPFIDADLKRHVARFMGDKILKAPYSPSLENPFGSTDEGVDLLSLIVVGAKETLGLVLAITVIRYIIAVPLGMIASKGKGFAFVLLHTWNHVFSALPPLFSTIFLLTAPFMLFNSGRTFWVMIVIALVEVGRTGYIIQRQSYAISKTSYVEAARSMGVRPFDMYIHQYFPVLLPEIVVQFFLDMGRVLLLIGQIGVFGIFISQQWVQLTFGFGELRNTSHNWATLLALAKGHLLHGFWIAFYPALAITFGIFMFNLLGEGLRQHFQQNHS